MDDCSQEEAFAVDAREVRLVLGELAQEEGANLDNEVDVVAVLL